MKKLLIVFAVAGAMVSCGGEEAAPATDGADSTSQAAITPEVEYLIAADAAGPCQADFSISGMSCEMMCVGSVKNELASIEGVDGIEFPEFDGSNEMNHAIVKFDRSVVSEEDMIAAINKVNGGHYQVHHVVVDENQVEVSTEDTETEVEEPAAGGGESVMETSSSVNLPNPANLVRGLFNALS